MRARTNFFPLAVLHAVIDKANDWRVAVYREIQAYIDERSAKWRDSERGQAYQEWLSEYEYVSLNHTDLDMPEELTLDDGDQTDMLEGLSETVPD